MNFEDIEPINFKLESTITWGVEKGRYSKYTIPTLLDKGTRDRIMAISERYHAECTIYGSTLYLKCQTLSDKQKYELLDKGRMRIMIHFQIVGTYGNGVDNYLVFKVKKLRKLEDMRAESAPED